MDIKPWTHPSGRPYFRATYYDSAGNRRHITRATEKQLRIDAYKKAQELATNTIDLTKLAAPQMRQIQKLLEADPSLSLVDEFLVWKGKKRPRFHVAAAVDEFLRLKEANQGASTQNLRTLRKHLTPFSAEFGTQILADITVSHIEGFLSSNTKNGNRTRKNIRASLVTFFRWCVSREYLPEGKTVSEKVARPITSYKIPETFTPEEIKTMLAAVRPEYLAWLVLGAFAGFRTDEICPIAGSRKSPLDWSDFQWGRDLIIVRPETAKTKHRRVVPILPVVRAFLFSIKKDSGPVHASPAPTKRVKGSPLPSETMRLGALVGGWRQNALRHSFISYRAADVGIGQTAMEAGNSESEVKRSYNDAKGKDEAKRWFDVRPMFSQCSQ